MEEKKDKRNKGIYTKFSDDVKLQVCKDHYENHLSYQELAKKYQLYSKTGKMMMSQMLAWFRIYRDLGDNGFKVHRQGNRTKYGVDGTPKDPKLNKRWRELREENEKLKLQVEYLKKLNALVQENQRKEKSFK